MCSFDDIVLVKKPYIESCGAKNVLRDGQTRGGLQNL